MKVKVGKVYTYNPCLLDRIDGRTTLCKGELVKVVNLRGAPKANTMNHCYVERLTGEFAGLVCTGSLE